MFFKCECAHTCTDNNIIMNFFFQMKYIKGSTEEIIYTLFFRYKQREKKNKDYVLYLDPIF